MTATRTGNPIAAAVVVAVGCAATSAGAAPLITDGPLGPPGGDSTTACMAKQDASEMVVGFTVVSNSSDHPVALDRAVLVGASGVSLTAARVADVRADTRGDTTLFGHANGNPPTGITRGQRQIVESSKPLEGFSLAPSSTGVVDNVLMYLRLDDPAVTAEIHHVLVYYHQGTARYVWQNNVHYILSAANCTDPGE